MQEGEGPTANNWLRGVVYTVSRVWTSSEVFELSQVDDELIQDQWN